MLFPLNSITPQLLNYVGHVAYHVVLTRTINPSLRDKSAKEILGSLCKYMKSAMLNTWVEASVRKSRMRKWRIVDKEGRVAAPVLTAKRAVENWSGLSMEQIFNLA